MRVLLVGNYDIAGKYIAERLYKEGHRVCWHTEDPEKKLWDDSVNGNVYRYELNYRYCSQIMKAESPDCLIFLTQEYRDVHDWTEGRMINMSDSEIEVLRAASSLGLKKVLYLSSKELEKEELLNPALEKLRGGERLCKSVCEESGMECLIVRSGIVYGEASGVANDFVDDVLQMMINNKKISTKYAAGSKFDFIYGSDYADAIERLLANEEKGLHILTTGYPVKLQDFYDLAAEKTEYKQTIEYGILEHRENADDCLQIKRRSGWIPFYRFESRMPQIIERYVALYEELNKETVHKKEKRDFAFLKALVQNLVLFAFFMLFDYYSADWSDLRFLDVKLLYVVIIAITFGMKQGIIAVILAIVAYFRSMIRADVDITYFTYSIDTWVPFIIYSVAGILVGHVSDKKNDEIEISEEEYQSLREKYNFLKSMYQEVLNIKNQLQKQIMISKDSLGHIYEITEELDDTRPRTVMLRAVKVVEDTMECTSVAIYTRGSDSSYGRLMACSGDIARRMKGSFDFREYEEMEKVLVKGDMYINTGLLDEYPSFAMPVKDGANIVAVVMIYNLDPGKYTIYYRDLFKTLILIMRSCLIRAYNYQEDNRNRIFFKGTNILKNEEFKAELESLNQANEELQYPFSYGKVEYDRSLSFEEVAERLSKSIRATDIAGCDEEGNIYIILLFVSSSLRGYTEQRFEAAGLSVSWEN